MENTFVKRGSRVRFALRRVICPGLEEIFRHIDSGLEVEGQITFLSDSGKLQQHFAIVDVKGIHLCLIVPTEALQVADGSEKESIQTLVDKGRLVG